MSEGPNIVRIASLIGERGRAEILGALMAGQALTATELAESAGVTRQTASSHLAKLIDAQLIGMERQGRHRYFRLANVNVGQMLEGLMTVAAANAPRPLRVGPRDLELRKARICYDHLAGELGVLAFAHMREAHLLMSDGDELRVTDAGARAFGQLGIDIDELRTQRRPLCRSCLDWSERRHHLAGALGAALLNRIFELQWARRIRQSRAIKFSTEGEQALRNAFGTCANSDCSL
jgi:DNA-binding transcriptional ArsR family regulator